MQEDHQSPLAKEKSQPYRVRLPGFVADETIGLGDALKRVTASFGLRPCGGCEKRAGALNRFLLFSGSRTKRDA